MLSEAPHPFDFVYHTEYGNGVVTKTDDYGYHIDLASLNRVVYFYNTDPHLSFRYKKCEFCHYEKIIGRHCGEPCI